MTVGLDITPHEVRAVRVDAVTPTGLAQVAAIAVEAARTDAPSGVAATERIAGALARAVDRIGVGTDPVHVAVRGTATALAAVPAPTDKERATSAGRTSWLKRHHKTVTMTLPRHGELTFATAPADHALDELDDPPAILGCAGSDDIAFIEQLARMTGITVGAIDLAPLAIARAHVRVPTVAGSTPPKALVGLVHMDTAQLSVVVLAGVVPVGTLTLPFGDDDDHVALAARGLATLQRRVGDRVTSVAICGEVDPLLPAALTNLVDRPCSRVAAAAVLHPDAVASVRKHDEPGAVAARLSAAIGMSMIGAPELTAAQPTAAA